MGNHCVYMPCEICGDEYCVRCEVCNCNNKPIINTTMQVTNNKIDVTMQMMTSANMTRGSQLGVPVDPQNPSLGLKWVEISQMSDADFDKIEEYFIYKSSKK